MKVVKIFALSALIASSACEAIAASCPDGNAALNQNTSLQSLCPGGFTSNAGALGPSDISAAMNAQPDNVAMIKAAAANAGVPADLALAVSFQESRFNSCAGSPTGVKGPMQLTQGTARALGYNRDINEQNIKGGMAVLKQAVNKCGTTNYACLSASYNGSNPTQQAQWAEGVQNADNKLQNNPSLVASCSPAQDNGSGCPSGPGDFPTTPAPTTPTVSLSA